MIILDVIIFKLSQKQDKRFLNSSLDVNGHFVWNRLSAELQISKNKVTVINLSIFNRPFLTRWDILMNLSIKTDVLKVQEVFRKGDYESRCLQMLIFFPYFQQSLKVLLCILRLAIVHTYIIMLIIHCNVYYYCRPYFLSNHLDGLPVEPEVHVLVLRHDLPAAPAQHRLPDEEGDPLPPDGHTGAPVTHNLNNYYNYY